MREFSFWPKLKLAIGLQPDCTKRQKMAARGRLESCTAESDVLSIDSLPDFSVSGSASYVPSTSADKILCFISTN